MGIIDLRVRPAYGSFLPYFDDQAFIKEYTGSFGFEVPESVKQKSIELLEKEIQEADIEFAVLAGRGLLGTTSLDAVSQIGEGKLNDSGVGNQELFDFAKDHNKFRVFPFIHPIHVEESIATIDKYIIHGDGIGAIMENGYSHEPFEFDDERAFPVYRYLEENHIPLMVSYEALMVPFIDSRTVYRLDYLASKFPKLHIAVVHGGWPWVREVIGVALKNPNVYIIPDLYGTRVPGGSDYILAANGITPTKIIFASAYPWLPIKDSIEYYKKESGLKESEFQNYFHDNALRFLNY